MANPLLQRYSHLKDFKETSPATPDYNCIAWAAEDQTRWWWPDNPSQFFTSYWPGGLTLREATIDCFVEAFSVVLGYEECDTRTPEAGFQKVAIYVNAANKVTHMARQLPSGRWTSKLGRNVDIEHGTIEEVEGNTGPEYGTVALIMKRRVPEPLK